MNIQYLKYAVEVARIGSISRAAEELYIAQPNLSRAIKELEKDLGITIFDRNSKGMTLTHDGERLIEYGKAILRQINEVENAFKGQENEKKSFSISVPRAQVIFQVLLRSFRSVWKRKGISKSFIRKPTRCAR